MSRRVALTTLDNPYNPIKDFQNWKNFDDSMGYYTSELLSRVVVTSSELPDSLLDADIEQAVDEIVKYNISGIYKKIVEEI